MILGMGVFMLSRITTSLVLVHLIYVSVVSATIINVPGDHPTIQAGIDASSDGDTIMVAPGRFNETLIISGKDIHILSKFGPDSSFITASPDTDKGWIWFEDNTKSTLRGFTIKDKWDALGGIVFIKGNSTPRIENCLFTNLYNSYSIINNQNSSTSIDPTEITSCVFAYNPGQSSEANTISSNGSYTLVRNSILWNTGFENEINGGEVIVSYSDIYNGWSGEGNINSHPEFVDPASGDFHFQVGSPCINSGDPSLPKDSDGSVTDMGVYGTTGNTSIHAIESVNPTQNALNVRQDTDISVTFGPDIDPESINTNTFVIHASQTGLHRGTYSYVEGSKTATLDITDDFAVGENVSVTLTSEIQSNDGYPINPFQWSFSVETLGGSGTFTNQVAYSTSNDPRFVISSDLDGDGDLDLAVTNRWSHTVSIFRNNGDGIFADRVEYSTGDQPKSVTSADLDKDGDMDLATVNQGDNSISILMNNGDGTFAAKVDSDVSSWPKLVTSGDLDGDGDKDLVVISYTSVSVLLNNGVGTFASSANYSTGSSFSSAEISDLDGDGDIDLAVTNYGSNIVSIFRNNGNGTFSSSENYNTGGFATAITISDLDGDGDGDLAVANGGDGGDGIISILMNNGDGTFANNVDYNIGVSDSMFVESADLDGDGDMDLIVADVNSDYAISILLNHGNGIFAGSVDYYNNDIEPWSVIASDLDGDGDMDLATANQSNHTISILFNNEVYSTNIFMGSSIEFSDSILFEYRISNPDGLITSLECNYSIDNKSTWHMATVIGDTSGLAEGTWMGTIIWDSYADLPGQDISDALFSITPYSSTETGRAGIQSFHLDNNGIPIIELTPPAGEQRLEISIPFQLSDLEIDSLGLLCEYFTSTSTWRTATILSDTAAISTYNGQLIWNSLSDLPSVHGEQLLRITPYDNDPGIADTVSIFMDQLGLSVATSISQYSAEQTEDIIVDYTLTDDESDLIDIQLEYSVDSGINWFSATVTGTTAGISSDSYSGTITWHSLFDLPGVDMSTVQLKLTPNDGNVGLPIETSDFHLDNNLPPMIYNLTLSDSITVIASLSYSLADSENDTLNLDIEYSTDQGQTWNSGIAAAGLSAIFPINYTDTIDWYTYESFGFQRLQDVWVKFNVSDNDPGTDTTLKNITILNYPAEYTGNLAIDTDDLVIFAFAWNADPQDTLYEIGPAIGIVPELTPEPDGVMDFEDLAVFVQMWNWSYTNNGLLKPAQLAKTNTEESRILDFKISSPHDKWDSDGVTSISIESDIEELLQVEWLIECDSKEIKHSVSKGDYFTSRYQTTPFLTKVSDDSTLSSFCITGLGYQVSKSAGSRIAEISISNQSRDAQTVNLYFRVWNVRCAIVESGQMRLEIESFLPETYSLQQNYPNPFNPSTTIRYTLPKPSDVSLSIYNIRGELVNTLVSKPQEAGYHQLIWQGEDNQGKKISSGMYIYRITTPEFTSAKKMVLLK